MQIDFIIRVERQQQENKRSNKMRVDVDWKMHMFKFISAVSVMRPLPVSL